MEQAYSLKKLGGTHTEELQDFNCVPWDKVKKLFITLLPFLLFVAGVDHRHNTCSGDIPGGICNAPVRLGLEVSER